MNPQPQGQPQLLPAESIIKPGQVNNLPFLNPEQKAQYTDGTRNLWRKVQEYPPDHPERLNAYRRLSEISTRLKREMMRWKSEQGGQGALQDPSRQLQRDPSMLMVSQPNPRQATQAPTLELSERVKAEVRTLPLVLPASLKARTIEEQRTWAEGQKRYYAGLLQKYETAMKQRQDFTEQVNNRRQRGVLTVEEQQVAQTRAAQISSSIAEAQKLCVAFKAKHEQARDREVEEQRQQQQVSPQAPLMTHSTSQSSLSVQAKQSQDNIKVEPSTQNTSVSEVPRATINQQEQPSLSTPEVTQQNANVTQNPQAQPPSTITTISHQQPGKLQDSPQSAQSGASNSQGPHPLSHQDALNRASRSYNQPPQPSHTHPTQPPVREQPTPPSNSNNQKMRPINVAPPTQVQLAPARPTLSGGPGAAGPMGQPAIQRHPGFVLEGEGERVLSKKKLEELVRQVTGGSGAGNEGSEILDPDVEEVSLYFLDYYDTLRHNFWPTF